MQEFHIPELRNWRMKFDLLEAACKRRVLFSREDSNNDSLKWERLVIFLDAAARRSAVVFFRLCGIFPVTPAMVHAQLLYRNTDCHVFCPLVGAVETLNTAVLARLLEALPTLRDVVVVRVKGVTRPAFALHELLSIALLWLFVHSAARQSQGKHDDKARLFEAAQLLLSAGARAERVSYDIVDELYFLPKLRAPVSVHDVAQLCLDSDRLTACGLKYTAV